MVKLFYGLMLMLCFCSYATMLQAEVYRWVDEQGNVHFTDRKHAKKQAENIAEQLQQQNIDHSAKRTESTLQQIDHRRQAEIVEEQHV